MQEKTSINILENFIVWVIAIILTLGMLVGVFLFALDLAHAESMPDNEYNYIIDKIENADNYNNITTYMSNYVKPYFPYFIEYSDSNYIFYKFVPTANSCIGTNANSFSADGQNWYSAILNMNTYSFKGGTDRRIFYSLKSNLAVNNLPVEPNHSEKRILAIYLCYDIMNNSLCMGCYCEDNGYIVGNNNQTVNVRSYENTNNILESNVYVGYVSNSTNSYWFTWVNTSAGSTIFKPFRSSSIWISYHTFNTMISNYDGYCMFANSVPLSGCLKIYRNIDDYLEPTASTNGFNVFIYNDLGIDYVRFVPNGLVTVGSHYSNNPTITFDLVLNDEVTIPVTYDESAGYYFESIEYNKAYYEIPVIELLPSSIADFDNIYITNVVYTNEWSTVGDSGTDTFYYLQKCWLKRTYNNEEIGQVSVPYESTDTGYSQQEITDIYNMITNASTLEGTFDVEKNLSGGSSSPISFSSFQDAVVRQIECYHPTGTKSSDWVSITIDNITYDSGDNMYWLEYNSNSQQSFEHRYNYNVSPYSYVRENNYAGYYDIIYFIVHEQVYDSSGTGFSTLDNTYTRYYYFISNRYYSKLMLYREMDILEYLRLGNEGQEKIYDYLFYKINNIDDNAYHFFKDKLNIDNDIVDKIREIDNSITLSTDSIMDLLNRILDALLDINIEPVEPLDITPITSRLDLILEKQTNSNLNNDWYKNFRQWLYEETDNSLVDTPHEWFIDKLNSIKSLYNIFGGHDTTFYYTPMMNVIDGYIHGQDLLNDETTYSTFYYKGTWSDGFNTSTFDSYHINNNNEVQ